ncbi:hypothetical protein NPX13_g2649 [Xylaria arbuscula]|uniref:Zn(2)-C6 fungal-type domain-containing protein n=1 Tax=Xylaria arbuscula TaxID=114810 RepID=A0A9W8NK32_9PEZI|nr:hypothetical protein NPX13_g2649 [Xylaria arbuscula]
MTECNEIIMHSKLLYFSDDVEARGDLRRESGQNPGMMGLGTWRTCGYQLERLEVKQIGRFELPDWGDRKLGTPTFAMIARKTRRARGAYDVHIAVDGIEDTRAKGPDMTSRSQDSQLAGKDPEPQQTPRKKGVRCRTGCWNCNGKRPTCETCSQKGEVCQWGIRLSFRPENSYSVPDTHPSMRQASTLSRDVAVEFYDITHEIIRDYQAGGHVTGDTRKHSSHNEERSVSSPASIFRTPIPYQGPKSTRGFPYSPEPNVTSRPSYTGNLTTAASLDQPDSESPGSMDSTESMNMLRSAAAQLLDLGCAPPSIDLRVMDHGSGSIGVEGDYFLQPGACAGTATTTPATARLSEHSHYDDGIFLPGSTYLELHSTLRDRIFDTARSAQTSRAPSPGIVISTGDAIDGFGDVNYEGPSVGSEVPPSPPTSTPLFAELEWQDEYNLWKNWVDEIAPWVSDPALYLRQIILCNYIHSSHPVARQIRQRLSFRSHIARHGPESPPLTVFDACALRSPAGAQVSRAAIIRQPRAVPRGRSPADSAAADKIYSCCGVLRRACVLEMMSCSPKMWRRHLDGCASLIQSVGINGFSPGLEKALFWCFARMGLCPSPSKDMSDLH